MLETLFQIRRCCIEVKLQFGTEMPEMDLKLLRNVTKGQRWPKMILTGKAFADIVEADGISKRGVLKLVDLVVLASDVLQSNASGTQPFGLTSDYLIKSGFHVCWFEQRKQFAYIWRSLKTQTCTA